jgi:PAS domain S-box-containing protein
VTSELYDLRRSLANVEGFLENANVGVYESLPEGRYLYVNPKMAEIFGYDSPRDMIDSVRSIIEQVYANPEDRAGILDQLASTGNVMDFEFLARRKDNSYVWVMIHAWAVYDEYGGMTKAQGFLFDISARKASEQALRESETKFRELYEHSTDGIIIADNQSRVLDANPMALEILGYGREEIRGMSGMDLNHPEDAEGVRALAGKIPYDKTLRLRRRFLTKGGEYIPVEVNIRRLDEQRNQILFRDITNRLSLEEELSRHRDELERLVEERTAKLREANVRLLDEIYERINMESELRQSQSDLSALINSATQGIILYAMDGTILAANEAMTRRFLRASGDIKGRNINELLPAEYLDEHQRRLETIQRTKSPLRFCESHGAKSFEISCAPVLDDFGEVDRLAVYVHDMSEQRRMMEDLKAGEERYRLFTENQLDVIWTMDTAFNYTYVSPSVQRLLGHTPEEIKTKAWHERFSEDSVRWLREKIPDASAASLAAFIDDCPTFQLEYLKKDGGSVWAEVTARTLRDKNGALTGFSGSTRDISERKKAEEQVRLLAARTLQAQENERRRIGIELHDTTVQTLTAVKVMIEDEVRRLGKEMDEKKLARLSGVPTLVSDTIRELRRAIVNLRPTVLDDMGLAAAMKWLCSDKREAHPRVDIDCSIDLNDYQDDDLRDTALFRVAQEALNNALRHSGADSVSLSLRNDAEFVELAVEDNGSGFDAAGADGIGIRSMRERVEPLNGSLNVESESGRGSLVKAKLPCP